MKDVKMSNRFAYIGTYSKIYDQSVCNWILSKVEKQNSANYINLKDIPDIFSYITFTLSSMIFPKVVEFYNFHLGVNLNILHIMVVNNCYIKEIKKDSLLNIIIPLSENNNMIEFDELVNYSVTQGDLVYFTSNKKFLYNEKNKNETRCYSLLLFIDIN
jgi:hypothetical protein